MLCTNYSVLPSPLLLTCWEFREVIPFWNFRCLKWYSLQPVQLPWLHLSQEFINFRSCFHFLLHFILPQTHEVLPLSMLWQSPALAVELSTYLRLRCPRLGNQVLQAHPHTRDTICHEHALCPWDSSAQRHSCSLSLSTLLCAGGGSWAWERRSHRPS